MTYELRTYTATAGRLDDLLARFRDHTTRLFDKHGMSNVGYWIPREPADTLIYVLRHDADPTANWAAFQADEEWRTAKAESEAKGPLTTRIVSVMMDPTDFSTLA